MLLRDSYNSSSSDLNLIVPREPFLGNGIISNPCRLLRQVFKRCGLEWKLRVGCANPRCECDVNKLNRDFWFSSSVVPADEIDVAIQEGNICHHSKTFRSRVLYATCGRTQVLVPLKPHVSAFSNQSDLETVYCVNQRDPHGRESFPSKFTHSAHSTSDGMLSASFTIFWESFMNLPRPTPCG
ncbi:hypothetical protein AZE42_13451 [Rhizopogon vesiculosus]|uniref:Uncharacterized protein n=1 Tax=Rhizopogon vesiculosus TaxID=180088 RepID=A0A1J8RDS9_9AGAM|nr:hypothetical protein AZE42_13451 [Rhizopogon vesiculosus]